MKILMVIPTFWPIVGGAERQLEGIAKRLVAMRHDLTIVTRMIPGAQEMDGSFSCIVRRIGQGTRLSFHLALAMYLLVNGRRFEIIHCHTLSGPAVTCTVLGFLLRRPVMLKVTRSGPGSQIQAWGSSVLRRLAFRVIAKFCACFVAISEDAAAELQSLGVDHRKIARIPNGVELFPLLAPPRSEIFEILYTGRLIRRKRVDMLLRAFAEFKGSLLSRLTIVGDGSERDSLTRLARELGVESRVRFAGELSADGVRRALEGAAVFVLPSSSEGMSNSLLEAMSAARPVIAADIDANRELISSGVSGLLFSSQQELVNNLESVFSDAGFAQALGIASRRVIEDRYAFDAVAGRYETLYRAMTR